MPVWTWHLIGYVFATAAAMIVIWAFFADRPRGRQRCRGCWYDLSASGQIPITCPECGRLSAKPKDLLRVRRHWKRAMLGVLIFMVGYGVFATPRVLARGWRGAVPTTALILAAPWLPRAWESDAFYQTKDPGEQYINFITFMKDINAEANCALTSTPPTTLAEELLMRWKDEPGFVHRLGHRFWSWELPLAGKPWYWKLGSEPDFTLQAVPWLLRLQSFQYGDLSKKQAEKYTSQLLTFYTPQLYYMDRIDLVGIDPMNSALTRWSPRLSEIRVRLLNPPETASNVACAFEMLPNRSAKGVQPLGPIATDGRNVTLEYEIVSKTGAILSTHTVEYRVEILEVPEGRETEALQQWHFPAGNIYVQKVNGRQVRGQNSP